MPIYEYRCDGCQRRVSIFVRSVSNPGTPACPRCGSTALERLFSRFARVRSDEDRLDRLADDSSLADVNEDDPGSVAQWMKKMGKELGEDVGEDFDGLVDEAMEEEGSPEGEGDAEGGDDS
ncbi:MAG TPA: zinc ribbon domain-containing protein [Candidatus Methylomirabilis sp.]|nr:zinc ribbon domain-containing protein [Candidatus Methylomirabilis sp.]